jgi:hypothetical protein
MTDPQSPVLDDEQSPAAAPIKYVEWVHFGDPGWRPAVPGSPVGAVSVAWALHFDGERVERNRGEHAREQPDDPWWMRAQQYRDRITSWQATGGATDGTVVSFWVDADAVEIDHSDATRLRIKVYGRDILTPLGYPVPSPPADKRYPVQVHMFVNRLTVGPMLDAEEPETCPTWQARRSEREDRGRVHRPVRRLPAAVELLPGRL